MKTKILQMIFAILLITNISSGQVTYFHYIDYTSKWNNYVAYFAYNSVCNYSVTTLSAVTEYISGDTMIGGNWYYKKFTFKRDSVFCPSSPFVTTYTEGPEMIREDSLNKVYYWDNFNSTEKVRWDFNILIGDTDKNSGCIVANIDTVWLGSTPLKRFHCGCSQPTDTFGYIIEGIGTNRSSLCGTGIEYNRYFVCYQKQTDLLQVTPDYQCNIMTGLQNFDTGLKDYFSIYPNPFTHSATLRITNNEHGVKNYELKIYDVLGQMVHQQTLNSRQETLNLNLPSGIYFYKLNNERKEIIGNGKLIIQ